MPSNVLALGRKVLNSHALHQSATSGQGPHLQLGVVVEVAPESTDLQPYRPSSNQALLCVCCVILSFGLNISELQADLQD